MLSCLWGVIYQKGGPEDKCKTENTATLSLSNKSDNTYSVYINNEYKRDIKGKEANLIQTKAGFVKITFKQKDTVFATPPIDYELTLKPCEMRSVYFP